MHIPNQKDAVRKFSDYARMMPEVDVDCVLARHATSKYPTGHYVRTIGKAGDIDCESEVGWKTTCSGLCWVSACEAV
eukprot:2592069-Rhodomonas_salina.4